MATAFAGLVVVPDVAAAATATRYVATTGADGANTCLVRTKPCKTIQHAVDAAASGDTIDIAKGSYDESVRIGIRLALRGAGSDDTTILGNPDRTDAGITIVGPADTKPLIVSITGLAVQSVLRGPAITATNADLTVTDGYVTDSLFGLLSSGGSLTVTDSVLSDNGSGEGSGTLQGGGVLAAGATTITRSTLSGNAGPGLFAFGNIGGGGGATTVTVSDSSISNNLLTGVLVGGATFTLRNSTLDGNRGAGVLSSEATTAVTNTTISGTRTAQIEGLPTEEQAGILTDLTDTTDRTGLAPAAVLRRAASSLPSSSPLRKALAEKAPARRLAAVGVTVTGSILDDAAVPDCNGDVVDGGYNLSSDAKNSCGFTAAKKSLVRTDPRLGEFGLNGGPTETRVPAAGSKAIDAIPSGSAGCVKGATDERGIARPQGTRCDIGAVEIKAVAVPPVRITTKSLPAGQVGDAYRKTLAATGGDGDYAWTLAKGSSLPDGLELSRGGVITGTPTEAGTFSLTVVADGASRRYTLVIAAAGTDGNGADPIANTGAQSASLTTWGAALVLLGFVVLLAAGFVGRRPGRHRSI